MQDMKLKTRRVLESVYNNGGEATTSEIKEQTGIDKSATIRYHAEDKLGEAGLVTTHIEQTEEHPGGIRVVEITEEGRERIAHLFDGTEDIPIKERMEDIESRFRETEEHVSELVGVISDIEEEVEEHSEAAERALDIAEDTRDIFDVLRTDVMTKIEDNEAHISDLQTEIESLNNKLDEKILLDHRVEDIETRLDRIEESTEEPESDSVSVDGAVVEAVGEETESTTDGETDRESRFIETEEGKEIRRYLSDLDAIEHGIRNRADLLDHLREQGYNLTEEQLKEITERVAVFA